MAYYSYLTATGQLVEVSDFEIPTPENGAMSFVEITKAEIDTGYTWNAEHLTFVPKNHSLLTKKAFLKKFTAQEYAAIKTAAAANAILDYYWQLFMVAEGVDLGDQDTISGIHMLEQIGLLNQGRATEILS